LLAMAVSAPYMIDTTPNRPTSQLNDSAASGKSGYAMRIMPYPPIFSSNAARITETGVGASTCASGNQVWKGTMGNLMANPTKSSMNAQLRAGHPPINHSPEGSSTDPER